MFTDIIDYAGMFPPASLSLEQAIRNYARFRQEPESWMLGRFICPATRLAELSPYVDELFSEGPPLVISTLGRGGDDSLEFGLALADELKAIVQFQLWHGPRAIVAAFETKLPGLPWDSDIRQVLFFPDAWLKANGTPPVFTYYEIPFWPKIPPEIPAPLEAAIRGGQGRKGLKMRCGGDRPPSIPSTMQAAPRPRRRLAGGGGRPPSIPSTIDIALTILICRIASVPLKFTAGLHHAIRHWNDQLGLYSHGFLNVFVSGSLNYATAIKPNELESILEDQDTSNFAFDSQGVQWHDWRVTVAEIEMARRHAVTSFGSCSFDEPRDDLRAMGLIP